MKPRLVVIVIIAAFALGALFGFCAGIVIADRDWVQALGIESRTPPVQ